jgi:subtilisin family serine protease
VVRADATVPNDTFYQNGFLWGLDNAGQLGGVPDADVDAPEAWDIARDANDVVVAVIDSGIRYTHSDLAENMWRNPGEVPGNGIDDDKNGFIDDIHGINTITGSGNPWDDNGHGTHVAGTIGAVGNNGIGVVGVAWRVKLMALKFLDRNGVGFTSSAVTCIDYALKKGVKILNNSWGGPNFSQALQDAISVARASGVIFVAAAGNDGINTDIFPHYPSAYLHDNIVSVAASNMFDELADFSNFGALSVDIAAPGDDILSTYYASNGSYLYASGTSMAAPFVSGALALLKARYPGDSYASLIDRVLSSADRSEPLAGSCATGGRLNLRYLLQSLNKPKNLDINRDSIDDITGVAPDDKIWYTTNRESWSNIPGHLIQLATGDFDGNGSGDIVGIAWDKLIWYTTDKKSWTNIPGWLNRVATGDINGDGLYDIAGVAPDLKIWYTTDKRSWTNIWGWLSSMTCDDINGDGADDIVGISADNLIWYTTNKRTWVNVPGWLSSLATGDLNGDGYADIVGISPNGLVWYTTDKTRWTNVPGHLKYVTTGDINGDGADDIVGIAPDNLIWYSLDKKSWLNIPGWLIGLATGDFNGDGSDDIVGVAPDWKIWYTTSKAGLAGWKGIPGALTSVYSVR